MDYKYLILAILCTLFFWIGYEIGSFLTKVFDDESEDEVASTLHDLYASNVKSKCVSKKETAVLAAKIVDYTIKIENYSITEICPHDIAVTRVISSVCTCETTAEFCADCDEQLTEHKVEC